MVFTGATVIAASLLIMHGLIGHTAMMSNILPVETWYVISVILAPVGYVIQDVVADAMTVEAVPTMDEDGSPFSNHHTKAMHTTMQMLGRFAIIGGTVLVALANVILFSGVDDLSEIQRLELYADIYLYALIIPAISVFGVLLAWYLAVKSARDFSDRGIVTPTVDTIREKTEVNWSVLLGSLIFVIFSVSIGALNLPFAQEIVFAGSAAIILFLMSRLVSYLPESQRLMIVGTAIIILSLIHI